MIARTRRPHAPSSRSRSSTWSSLSPSSGSRSSTGSSARSRSSTWSKGSAHSGRRLSVRALDEWNRLHPRTPMTEDDLEIRSPVGPEDAPPVDDDGAGTLLERLLDNVLREYPNIDVAVGDWTCITAFEEVRPPLARPPSFPALTCL